jgi:2-iminobutanoate/2-iminopropanoate deaminase
VQAQEAAKKIIYPPLFKENRPDMPFSPGVQVGNLLFLAGQTGSNVETGEYPESFEDEVHGTFKRIGVILNDAGYDFSDVVDAKVYLTDIGTFPQMTKIFTEYFKSDRPARTTVAIASLVGKARIEITVIAAK